MYLCIYVYILYAIPNYTICLLTCVYGNADRVARGAQYRNEWNKFAVPHEQQRNQLRREMRSKMAVVQNEKVLIIVIPCLFCKQKDEMNVILLYLSCPIGGNNFLCCFVFFISLRQRIALLFAPDDYQDKIITWSPLVY